MKRIIFADAMAVFLLVVGIAWFVAECNQTSLAQSAPIMSLADVYSEDAEALARLRVNEAGWPTRANPTNDGGMIGQYVMRRARQRGLTVAEFIARTHHRHTAVTSTRPWIAGLNRTMQEPPGWPASVPWLPRGHDSWRAALEEAKSVLNGEFAPCATVPDTWGGPNVDRESIARVLANGGRVVDCGPTRNVPLKFGRR